MRYFQSGRSKCSHLVLQEPLYQNSSFLSQIKWLEFPFVDSSEAVLLERPFQEEKVHGDKALCPVFVIIAFFFSPRSCCSIVKANLMSLS
jgi:hypothetical protein